LTRYSKVQRPVEQKDFRGDFSATNDTTGQFSGYLSTFGTVDLQGDRVMRGAFKKTIQDATARREQQGLDYLFPVTFGHNLDALPAGGIISAREDAHGLLVSGQLNMGTQAGVELYNTMKAKMIDRMSIGYRTIKADYTRENGQSVRELMEIALVEAAIVNTPANPDARVLSVKAQGGYAMPGKDFATNYHDEQLDDWACADWYDLSGALQQSVQECFSSGGDPMAALESDVIPAFLSALRAYVAEGVSLGYVPDPDEQMYPSMMSAGTGYDEKAGRTLSARTRAALSTIANGISGHVSNIQATVEKERAASLQGFPLYGSASARPELSRKAMMESSHTAIGAATSGIMTHVRSLKSMAYEARRQNDLRGWPIVRSRSSADLDLEEKLAIRAMTAELRETTESMERDRDPAVQHLRDLRESLPSSRDGGPTTQQRLEGMQANLAVDLALKALLDADA